MPGQSPLPLHLPPTQGSPPTHGPAEESSKSPVPSPLAELLGAVSPAWCRLCPGCTAPCQVGSLPPQPATCSPERPAGHGSPRARSGQRQAPFPSPRQRSLGTVAGAGGRRGEGTVLQKRGLCSRPGGRGPTWQQAGSGGEPHGRVSTAPVPSGSGSAAASEQKAGSIQAGGSGSSRGAPASGQCGGDTQAPGSHSWAPQGSGGVPASEHEEGETQAPAPVLWAPAGPGGLPVSGEPQGSAAGSCSAGDAAPNPGACEQPSPAGQSVQRRRGAGGRGPSMAERCAM